MFFLHFEKLATNLNWPKDHWTVTEVWICQRCCSSWLPMEPWSLLSKIPKFSKRYQSNICRVCKGQEQLYDRWCHSKKVNKDFEKLGQLILIEEFKRRIPLHMKTSIDEKQVENLQAVYLESRQNPRCLERHTWHLFSRKERNIKP